MKHETKAGVGGPTQELLPFNFDGRAKRFGLLRKEDNEHRGYRKLCNSTIEKLGFHGEYEDLSPKQKNAVLKTMVAIIVD